MVLGGTFDPVHNGHLHIASQAADELGTQATLVLAPVPQLRSQPKASVQQRWEMLEYAVSSYDNLTASSVELRRAGPTRTIDTLRDLSASPTDPVVWIMGADAARDLVKWHGSSQLPELMSVFLWSRPHSDPPQAPKGFVSVSESTEVLRRAGTCFTYGSQGMDVSATMVRAAVKRGDDIRRLVPEKVVSYIIENQLYLT